MVAIPAIPAVSVAQQKEANDPKSRANQSHGESKPQEDVVWGSKHRRSSAKDHP
jgi:hypothetical protein